MWDSAGTVEELLERSIGTILLLSLLTCFLYLIYKHILVCLLSPFKIMSVKGRAGQGMVGFLRRSPFAVCLKQGLRACQNLWHR